MGWAENVCTRLLMNVSQFDKKLKYIIEILSINFMIKIKFLSMWKFNVYVLDYLFALLYKWPFDEKIITHDCKGFYKNEIGT